MVQKVVDGSNDSNQPDYESIEVGSKPPTEFHYTERRAELLTIVRQAGHPSRINQTELADRYGVSQQQISKDLDRLAEYVDEELGERRALTTEAVFSRCVSELLDEGEWRDAARTQKEFVEWISEYQDMQEIEERLDRLEERDAI